MLSASGLLGRGVTLAEGPPGSVGPGVVRACGVPCAGGLPPDEGKGQQPETTTSKASSSGSTRHFLRIRKNMLSLFVGNRETPYQGDTWVILALQRAGGQATEEC